MTKLNQIQSHPVMLWTNVCSANNEHEPRNMRGSCSLLVEKSSLVLVIVSYVPRV